jgi:putative transposase
MAEAAEIGDSPSLPMIPPPSPRPGRPPFEHNLPLPPGVKSPPGTEKTPRRGVSTNALAAWKPGSLGAIINQFKSKCTKRIRASTLPSFAWQRGYYDHIIRGDRDLARIRRYIRLNPAKWDLDRYYRPT